MLPEPLVGAIEASIAWIAMIPRWALGLALLALAVLAALALHGIGSALIRRAVAPRWPFLASLVRRTRRLTRMALLLLAAGLALRSGLFADALAVALSKLVLVGFVVLAGWTAIVATAILADVYLLRFRIDTADNLLARKHVTQVRILKRAVDVLIVLLTIGGALAMFEAVRNVGVSIFASAGVAGLVAGLAARPVLSNLIAGVQIAMTQPIRIDDVVVLEGEFGTVKEITATYVVVRVWDWRRLIVPLSRFIEQPFQNWTREGAALIGSVYFYVDHTVPVARLRQALEEIVRASRLWDGEVANLQVTDVKETTIELRALVSARSSGAAWDLRCEVREKLIDLLQREYPAALPRRRQELVDGRNERPLRGDRNPAAAHQPEPVRGEPRPAAAGR